MNAETSHLAPVAILTGVGVRYGKTVALHGITLTLPAGRMVGLLGPDGVGKEERRSTVRQKRFPAEREANFSRGRPAAGGRNVLFIFY